MDDLRVLWLPILGRRKYGEFLGDEFDPFNGSPRGMSSFELEYAGVDDLSRHVGQFHIAQRPIAYT